MSQYLTKLREEPDTDGLTGRDGIQWAAIGTWKQNEDLSRLETFANNLDVSLAGQNLDLLNSVPTPWARLLLFESALYKTWHPAHAEIEDQWRGLLGVIALARPLGLNLTTELMDLAMFSNSRVGKTFHDLAPHYLVGGQNEEEGKWNSFELILVDGVVLGATSPRTLVITGVDHHCPPSLPFCSAHGRLTDPVSYYKKYNDTFFLGLLSRWITDQINTLARDPLIAGRLGYVPGAAEAVRTNRLQLLIERLQDWKDELRGIEPVTAALGSSPIFALSPFDVIKGLPQVDEIESTPNRSDLFLRGSNDTMACFHPGPNTQLVDSDGLNWGDRPLKVFDGRWFELNKLPPLPFSFLPSYIRTINEPALLFEDVLIQVNLPPQADSIHCVQFNDGTGLKSFLQPFKGRILNYFTPEQIAVNTAIKREAPPNYARVEFTIPLQNDLKLKVWKVYKEDAVVNKLSAELGVWPDFVSPAWHKYFYYKSKVAGPGQQEIDFEPIGEVNREIKSRSNSANVEWFSSDKPIRAFVGKLGGRQGLLLPNYTEIAAPKKFWEVGIDLGSTHTRAFSVRVEKDEDEFVVPENEKIKPVEFTIPSLPLTTCNPGELRANFFAMADIKPPIIQELKSLMMIPVGQDYDDVPDWLPREGFVYKHWIFYGDYESENLIYDVKWGKGKKERDLTAFLRCLLLMIQAQAIRDGAQVVAIRHAYPSVFMGGGLEAKHKRGWQAVGDYLNNGGGGNGYHVRIDAPLTESEAVSRYLESGQQAAPGLNIISLDVGGSTTDIAIWMKKSLVAQESVKMAAGLVGRYLMTEMEEVQEFLEWLEITLKHSSYGLKEFSLSKVKGKPQGYNLMFNSVLSYLDENKKLDDFKKQVNDDHNAHKLLAYIAYLFASLIYYTGLLTRKKCAEAAFSSYDLYFCGKGGQFINWINGYEVLVDDMFKAGFFGPDGQQDKPAITVNPIPSKKPKEEVGRGVLAPSRLKATRRDLPGIRDIAPPSVTVGETGYPGLSWDDELNAEVYLGLEDPPAKMEELRELMHFIKAFREGKATKRASELLHLGNVESGAFIKRLHQRIHGTLEDCKKVEVERAEIDLILEPLFLVEVKVLLETATDSDLFSRKS